MNRDFGPLLAWSSPRSHPRSTLVWWACFAFSFVVIISIIISIFPKSHPSFSNDRSDELQDYTAPLTYLPPVGLGTWQLQKSKAAKIVKFALEKGYRHIDAAMIYGK
jgi:hypothetical protein